MPSVWKREQRELNRIARKKIKDIQAITEIQQSITTRDNIPLGRIPKFETPEQLDTMMAQYFEEVKNNKEHPTLTGLALALGIDRKTLMNYSSKDDFLPIINKAKELILKYTEQMLIDKSKFTPWQIFYLKNNFKEDYQDRIEVKNEHSGSISLVELATLADSLPDSIIDWELIEEDFPQEREQTPEG